MILCLLDIYIYSRRKTHSHTWLFFCQSLTRHYTSITETRGHGTEERMATRGKDKWLIFSIAQVYSTDSFWVDSSNKRTYKSCNSCGFSMCGAISNGQACNNSFLLSRSKADDPLSQAYSWAQPESYHWVRVIASSACMQQWRAAQLCSRYESHTACDSKVVGNLTSSVSAT